MRALLIKMSSLGDVIHALPAVTDAARHGVRFDWVVEEGFAEIVRAHPAVQRVFPIAWRRWRGQLGRSLPQMRDFFSTLRADRYDAIIDSQGLIKSSLVSLLARGSRHGFSHTSAREPWAAFAYGNRIRIARRQHAIERQRQLFAEAFGYQLTDNMASGLEHHGPRDNRVVLLHGTTWESKHYPLQMWQALAQLISNDGYQPVVTWGSPAEEARARQIASVAGATLQNRLSLAELTVQLSSAALVIGVDSGLSHLSAALATPTLGLFGSTDGDLTGCRGEAAAILQAQVPCSPCLGKQCRSYTGAPRQWNHAPVQPPCFATLPPELVWQQGRGMIEAY